MNKIHRIEIECKRLRLCTIQHQFQKEIILYMFKWKLPFLVQNSRKRNRFLKRKKMNYSGVCVDFPCVQIGYSSSSLRSMKTA